LLFFHIILFHYTTLQKSEEERRKKNRHLDNVSLKKIQMKFDARIRFGSLQQKKKRRESVVLRWLVLRII